MANSLGELVSVIDRLIARMDELESRISALEHRPQRAFEPHVHGSELTARVALETPALAVQDHPLEKVFSQPGAGIAPAMGKLFLGIAGAYILRALAESGALPQMAIVAVALVYAATWLVWSARVSVRARFAGGAYAVTAALILSPMLWELTARFKVLPHALTAALLTAFALAGAALGWKRNLSAITWMTSLAATMTTLALVISTRDPAPFIFSLIAIAVCIETAACFGHCLTAREIVAAALDIAVLAVLLVYTAPQGFPPEYRPISSGLLLFMFAAPLAICAPSIAVRSIVQLRGITLFEVAQATAAFVLAWLGILRATRNSSLAALATMALMAATACYAVAFSRFKRAEHARGYHVYATWAALLAVTGCWMLLAADPFVVVLGFGALCATWWGTRKRRFTLIFHGLAFLTIACFFSGLPIFSWRALLGGFPGSVSVGVLTTAVACILCFAAVAPLAGEERPGKLVRLLFALPTLLVTMALAVYVIAALLFHGAPSTRSLAVIRTIVMCAAALLLGIASSHGRRVELVWLAYSTMALCTFKLLFEDLHSGSAGSMAIALFAYGLIWVLLPRFVRSRESAAQRL